MSREEKIREAIELEQQAATNDSYARAMEETSARTGGRLGADAAPNMYAAHLASAERKRLRAAELRAEAEQED